jgi:hypothetical protein
MAQVPDHSTEAVVGRRAAGKEGRRKGLPGILQAASLLQFLLFLARLKFLSLANFQPFP